MIALYGNSMGLKSMYIGIDMELNVKYRKQRKT